MKPADSERPAIRGRRILHNRTLLLLLLLLAAFVSWWIARSVDAPVLDERAMDADGHDYSLSEFMLTEMDEQGVLSHTLVAKTLYHYPDREVSILAQPDMQFFEQRRKTWDISAEEGLISEDDRSIFLSGNVHVHYIGETPDQGFEIYTEELYVWPDDKLAKTDVAVRITQPSGVTRSVGMRAEIDVRRLYLLSNVRSAYEPQQR